MASEVRPLFRQVLAMEEYVELRLGRDLSDAPLLAPRNEPVDLPLVAPGMEKVPCFELPLPTVPPRSLLTPRTELGTGPPALAVHTVVRLPVSTPPDPRPVHWPVRLARRAGGAGERTRDHALGDGDGRGSGDGAPGEVAETWS